MFWGVCKKLQRAQTETPYSINNGQKQVTYSKFVCLSTHACIIYGRSDSMFIVLFYPGWVSIFWPHHLSNTYFVWTSSNPPNELSHVPRTFFFFISIYPLVSLSHAAFFFAVFRKLIRVQPLQLGRVNIHYSELSPTTVDTDKIRAECWLSTQGFGHWSLLLFSQIQVTPSCSFLYN